MFYRKYRHIILPVAFFPVLIALWEFYIWKFQIPSYLLPRPYELLVSLKDLFIKGRLLWHIRVTLEEVFVGTLAGIAVGLILGYVMAKIRFIERLVMPFVIIVQTAPKISLAPLFILWLGLGIQSKIALVVLVVSFPVMINQVLAIRTIEKNVYHLMKILGASRWQTFRHVELAYSLEMMLSGIKLAVTQAMIGAVIGEMIGSKAGLGYLLILGNETYDIKLILNAVLILSFTGLFLYQLSVFAEKKLLYWKETDHNLVV